MHLRRGAVAYSASLIGSVAGPVVLYRSSYGLSVWALAASVLLFGLALGFAIGRLAGRVPAFPVAACAFCGIALLWVPVVVVSLGGVVFAFPGLVAYAALVALGANLGARLHRGASVS